MKLHTQIAYSNACYLDGQKMKPKGIMIHSTGANNPNLRRYVGPDDGILGKNIYNNHWNIAYPGGKAICCHAFIGKDKNGEIRTYQILPWNMVGWHCGGKANKTHIGIEICEDTTDNGHFLETFREAVEVAAYLCKLYNIQPKNIISHKEGNAKGLASNHGDPEHWWKNYRIDMVDFRNEVAKELDRHKSYHAMIYDTKGANE